MKKLIRITTLCMILVMVGILADAIPAFADESAEANVGDVVTETLQEETYGTTQTVDNDELFENYIEFQVLSVGDSVSETAGKRGAKLTGVNRAIYNKLKKEIALIAEGSRTSTAVEVTADEFNLEKNRWNAADLGVETIVANGSITEAAQTAVYDMLDFDRGAIVRALLADCPYELYWFDKVSGVLFGGLKLVATRTAGEWYLSLSSGVTVSFSVAQGYSAGDYLLDVSNMERVNHAVEKAAEIVGIAADETDCDKLIYYRETICDLVTYDSAAAAGSTAYGDSWQVISVFDEDAETNVVCEGYAKAFQYLCDLTSFDGDISCITVTGTMTSGTSAGAHMWNILNMEDGNNYLVDVTNCDTGTIGADDQLFLVGCISGTVNSGYTYMCTGRSVSYIYDSDTLNDCDSVTELTVSNRKYSHIHRLIKTEAKEAGCTENGNSAYWACSTCRKIYSDEAGEKEITKGETIIQANGHTEVVASAVAATCTQTGLTEGSKCSVCGEMLAKQEKIAALGHEWSEWTVIKEATEDENGLKTRVCDRDASHAEEAEIPKLSNAHAVTETGKAYISANVTTIPLAVKQTTTDVKISYGTGDGIVSWESDNPKVAVVNSKGKITGKKAGTALITVTLKSGLKKTIKVRVQKKAVVTTKVTVDRKSVSLKKGKAAAITTTVTPITSAQKVTYKTSNKKVAAVSKKGKITAKNKGKATITVTSGKKSVKVKVTVK